MGGSGGEGGGEGGGGDGSGGSGGGGEGGGESRALMVNLSLVVDSAWSLSIAV